MISAFCRRIFSRAGYTLSILLIGCVARQDKAEPVLSREEAQLKVRGELLAEKYCSGCHMTVAPELLDRGSWMRVLYQMQVEIAKAGMEVDRHEWDTISSYYFRFSDLMLEQEREKPIQASADEFHSTGSPLPHPSRPNITALSHRASDGSLFIGDSSKKLYWVHENKLRQTFDLGNIPINIKYDSTFDYAYVLCIGNLHPSEKQTGQLVGVDLSTGNVEVLLNDLDRPVHLVETDLDQDGSKEFIISCFGSITGEKKSGGLMLAERKNGSWKSRGLKMLPGATKAIVDDFNGDGKPDILALFAQGNERIIKFINTGSGFREETVLEFPPVYGVTDMALSDLNGDGRKELIVANGDNGDFSPVHKPYHGVRIYRSDRTSTFKEWFFQPINGAARLRLRDFDLDGDVDIVVLSIYPNLFRHPEETLVYLENKGNTFHPKYLQKEPSARWVILEAGDFDNDGDDDIVVGANNILTFPIPGSFTELFKNVANSISFFENLTR